MYTVPLALAAQLKHIATVFTYKALQQVKVRSVNIPRLLRDRQNTEKTPTKIMEFVLS